MKKLQNIVSAACLVACGAFVISQNVSAQVSSVDVIGGWMPLRKSDMEPFRKEKGAADLQRL